MKVSSDGVVTAPEALRMTVEADEGSGSMAKLAPFCGAMEQPPESALVRTLTVADIETGNTISTATEPVGTVNVLSPDDRVASVIVPMTDEPVAVSGPMIFSPDWRPADMPVMVKVPARS